MHHRACSHHKKFIFLVSDPIRSTKPIYTQIGDDLNESTHIQARMLAFSLCPDTLTVGPLVGGFVAAKQEYFQVF